VITLCTAQGLVKRVSTEDFPQRLDARPIIGLKPGDRLVFAASHETAIADPSDVVMITSDAQLLRFAALSVTPKGLAAGGMAGIRLSEGTRVLAAAVLSPGRDAVIVTVSNTGSLKVSTATDYPQKGRGTGGVRCQTFRKNESELVAAMLDDPAPVAIAASGAVIDYPTERTRRDGSGTPLETGIAGFGALRRS
jgi:DNA gyrase subunit A